MNIQRANEILSQCVAYRTDGTPIWRTSGDSIVDALSWALGILSNLSHTRDGIPMVPGMEVFGAWESTGVVHNVDGVNGAYVKQPGGVFWRDGSECSSVPLAVCSPATPVTR